MLGQVVVHVASSIWSATKSRAVNWWSGSTDPEEKVIYAATDDAALRLQAAYDLVVNLKSDLARAACEFPAANWKRLESMLQNNEYDIEGLTAGKLVEEADLNDLEENLNAYQSEFLSELEDMRMGLQPMKKQLSSLEEALVRMCRRHPEADLTDIQLLQEEILGCYASLEDIRKESPDQPEDIMLLQANLNDLQQRIITATKEEQRSWKEALYGMFFRSQVMVNGVNNTTKSMAVISPAPERQSVFTHRSLFNNKVQAVRALPYVQIEKSPQFLR